MSYGSRCRFENKPCAMSRYLAKAPSCTNGVLSELTAVAGLLGNPLTAL